MKQAVKRAVGRGIEYWFAAGLAVLVAAIALVATQPRQASASLTAEEEDSAAEVTDVELAEVAVIENDPFGAWSEVGPWPLVAIHAAVLDDGKVLSYTGTGDTLLVDIWDPTLGLGANSHSTFNNTLGSNLFCSFTLDDPNSENKLLVGGETAGGQAPNFVAQYGDNTLSAFPSMNEPRWYPTVTTLWDGRLLAQGGTPGNFDNRDDPTTVAEVYSPDNGWQLLEGTRDPGVWDTENYGWWYPKSHVTPSGKVWNLAWDQMYYIDPDGSGAVDLIDTFAGGNRGGSSSSVMYDTGLVLQIGGGERGSDDRRFPGSNAATIFNLNYDPPILTEAAPMNFARHWADATVLPDGRVLVTGGSLVNNRLDATTLPPEIWDPATDSWTVLTGNNTPRLYHSTTLLMPDASVLTAGGGKTGPVDNFNGQLFYPPYLYNADGSQAARPAIESAPRNIEYDQSISVTVDGPIDRVTLIKQSNSTHSMNSQIFSELSFSQTGNQLSIETPDYATVATPGEYLLFVLDNDGVPSVSRTVRLTGVGLEPPPPLEPLAAAITGTVDRVDGGVVAGVNIDLFEATADGARGQWLTSTATGSDGTYAFEDLDPGCYVLTFIAPQGQTFTNNSPWFQPGACIEASQTSTLDATLNQTSSAATAIVGTVDRVDGGVVAGVIIDLFEATADGSRGQWLTSTATDADGSYAFEDLDPNCYILTFIAPQGQTFSNNSPWFQPGTCIESGQTTNLSATLNPESNAQTSIAGTVVRVGGELVAGVNIDLFEATADGSRGQWLTSATTDSTGTYAFEDLDPNCYILTFIAPQGQTFTNNSPWFQPGTCIENGQTSTLDATLNPAG